MEVITNTYFIFFDTYLHMPPACAPQNTCSPDTFKCIFIIHSDEEFILTLALTYCYLLRRHKMAPNAQSLMPYNSSPSIAPAIERTCQFGDYMLPKYTFLQASSKQLTKQL